MFALTFWPFIAAKKIFTLFGSKIVCERRPGSVRQSWIPSSFTSKLCCFGLVIQSLHHPVSLYVKYPSQKALVRMESERVPGYLGQLEVLQKYSFKSHTGSIATMPSCLLLFIFTLNLTCLLL